MARKLRVEYPGAIYHVMNRGDRREAAEALLEMARLYEKTGAPDKAKSAMTEREKLLIAIEEK